MTHEELLIEILRRLNVSYYNGDPQSMNALRAVVELHKPVAHNGFTLILKKFRDYCNCGENLPCPTIQAIEKELK